MTLWREYTNFESIIETNNIMLMKKNVFRLFLVVVAISFMVRSLICRNNNVSYLDAIISENVNALASGADIRIIHCEGSGNLTCMHGQYEFVIYEND